MIGVLVITLHTSSLGQTRPSSPRRPTPLARYVPSSAKVFVKVRKLSDVDAALKRTDAWRLFSLLAGATGGPAPFDLREEVAKFFGPNSTVEVDALMNSELGIVAASWKELGGAIWLLRIRDEQQFAAWFPQATRRNEQRSGSFYSFIAGNGVTVYVRDDVAAIARRGHGRSMLHDIRKLMSAENTGEAGSLERADKYRELMPYLPARDLAIAYVDSTDPSKPDQSVGQSWPKMDKMLIGLYERDGRLELVLQGSPTTAHPSAALSSASLDRMMQLPQTTLSALATTVDFSGAYEAAMSGPHSSALRRYLTLFSGLRGEDSPTRNPIGQVGPDVILVWGRDLVSGGTTPHLGVMVHCEHARSVRDETTQIFRHLLELLQAVDPVDNQAAPKFELDMHLGTPIVHVPLASYAAQSQIPLMSLFAEVDIAWATWDEWFIVTTTLDQMEQILDGQMGLVPVLASVPEVRELLLRKTQRSTVAVALGSQLAEVLDQWVKEAEANSESLFNPSLWSIALDSPWGSSPGGRLSDLKVDMDQVAGCVVVAKMFADQTGKALLQPGDRVIGVDGHLLNMDLPYEDLRTLCSRSVAPAGPVLRLLRSEKVLDVTVPKAMSDAASTPVPDPAEALRALAALGHTLELAGWEVHATKEMRFSARLALHFAAVPRE